MVTYELVYSGIVHINNITLRTDNAFLCKFQIYLAYILCTVCSLIGTSLSELYIDGKYVVALCICASASVTALSNTMGIPFKCASSTCASILDTTNG